MHADEMDRAVNGMSGGVTERAAKESLELRVGHLAASHGKILVFDRAEPRNVSGYGYIPRRIGEHHARAFAVEGNRGVALPREGVGAE